MTSGDRETNHDMTYDEAHTDIALLLADATDEVEVGAAPYQAVLRGGRRRKTRRWAVAAAAAAVIAGSTGTTLALMGDTGGGHGAGQVAAQPSAGTAKQNPDRRVTTLARGTDHGRKWKVDAVVWTAPKTTEKARAQLAEMALNGEEPVAVEKASDLVGESWHFVRLTAGGKSSKVILTLVSKDGRFSTKLEAYSRPLGTDRDDAPQRLVIGQVARTVQEVTCTWDDGTKTRVERAAAGAGDFKNLIRDVDGSPKDWFVCLGPDGGNYKKAEVTG
ncbi:hypothetical protein [Streptomyces pseudovenezuelae]|uniref:Tat pathway signal sequence domain protein n=1 Tax=Streptomyces pseudovenezuelae TaxID=67350 RepID=A0ABZ1WMG9_9ACTN|nr:hypothetical protein [Streptomyces pseudovenezuelae]